MRRTSLVRVSVARALLGFAVLWTAAACSDGLVSVSPPDADLASAQAAGTAAAAPETRYAPGQVIALFEPTANAAAVASAHGASVAGAVGFGILRLSVAPGAEEAVANALSSNPNVRFAEPNWIYVLDVNCGSVSGSCVTPTDEFFPVKWDLHNDGIVNRLSGEFLANTDKVDADTDWLEAFDLLGDFQGSALVGMLDSGINPAHEEFAGRIQAARNFHDDPFFPVGVDPSLWADDNGHGSHTAAIVAGAGNNGVGISGTAYGANIGILVAKVCGPMLLGLLYGCDEAAIIGGIEWAVSQGANVLNLSLGGTEPGLGQQAALGAAMTAGVLPVCAAGNDGGPVNYPGAFPECLAVSATDWGDNLSSYSSFGPEVVLSAPGGDFEHPEAYSNILSAWIGGPSAYALAAGTSMATPQVAGLATLLHALGATSVQQKIDLMTTHADDLGAGGPDPLFGAGRINVFQSVSALVGGPPPPPGPPVAAFTAACSQLDCSFTDQSGDDSGIVGWLWNFGDGMTSNEQNPNHSYANAGQYLVTLDVTAGDGGTGNTSQPITVTANTAPTAQFSESCTDLSCDFTDESSDGDGFIAAWLWDFGDGNGSAGQNPSHSYAEAGSFTVALTVTDNNGASTTTQHDVTVTAPPVSIVLSATTQTRRRENITKLSWTPANPNVDIWRAPVGEFFPQMIAQNVPRGRYTDRTGTSGKIDYFYFVCETGNDQNCSNLLIVSF